MNKECRMAFLSSNQILILLPTIAERGTKQGNIVRALFEAFAYANNFKTVEAAFKHLEKIYRLLYDVIGKMPDNYRSTKSLVENAVQKGVKLVDQRGMARTKNAVSKDLARKRAPRGR